MCHVLSQKNSSLLLGQTLALRGAGISRSGLEHLARRDPSLAKASTFFRHFNSLMISQQQLVLHTLSTPTGVHLHWLDNYARHFAANGIWLNREVFNSMQWGAHGVKLFAPDLNPAWLHRDGKTLPAMSMLTTLLSLPLHTAVLDCLQSIPFEQYQTAFVTTRDVRRIPLKPDPITLEEKFHLALSSDGLRFFYPLEIHEHNIQSRLGLLHCFRVAQLQSGFGVPGHGRRGLYSFLHVDVSLYWSLIRLLYSYSGFASIRHDLFLCFGLWHPYMYGHLAIWNEFRHTFLAPAWFTLFPDSALFKRPKLLVSQTFFTWIRLAYPSFRDYLLRQFTSLRDQALQLDSLIVENIENHDLIPPNLYRARVIHLFNLILLLDFCIPVVQDYGSLLKNNDWDAFIKAYRKLSLLFILSRSPGTTLYRNSSYLFLLQVTHWANEGALIIDILHQYHTQFSEESGEIALSLLTHSLPASRRGNINETRKAWQFIGDKFRRKGAIQEELKLESRKKKHRVIGTFHYAFI